MTESQSESSISKSLTSSARTSKSLNSSEQSEPEPRDCDWVDNFCYKNEPETFMKKMYEHFVLHHKSAVKMLDEMKELNNVCFDKFEKCTDVYSLIQMLTFMYKENLQFKTIVDEFNSQYAATGVVEEKEEVKCVPATLCEKYRPPIEPPNKCFNVKNEPPYGTRSPTCDSVKCLDRDPPDPNSIFCGNSACDGFRKKRTCLGYFDDSKESIVEPEEEPKPIHEYFDCFVESKCKDSSCYPCNVTANQNMIKTYVEKYLKAVTAGEAEASNKTSEDDADNFCKCTGFRNYVIKEKEKKEEEQKEEENEEEETKEEVVCPCQQCPKEEETSIDGEGNQDQSEEGKGEGEQNEETDPEKDEDNSQIDENTEQEKEEQPCGGVCKPCKPQEQGDQETNKDGENQCNKEENREDKDEETTQEDKDEEKTEDDKKEAKEAEEESKLCTAECANVTPRTQSIVTDLSKESSNHEEEGLNPDDTGEQEGPSEAVEDQSLKTEGEPEIILEEDAKEEKPVKEEYPVIEPEIVKESEPELVKEPEPVEEAEPVKAPDPVKEPEPVEIEEDKAEKEPEPVTESDSDKPESPTGKKARTSKGSRSSRGASPRTSRGRRSKEPEPVTKAESDEPELPTENEEKKEKQ